MKISLHQQFSYDSILISGDLNDQVQHKHTFKCLEKLRSLAQEGKLVMNVYLKVDSSILHPYSRSVLEQDTETQFALEGFSIQYVSVYT